MGGTEGRINIDALVAKTKTLLEANYGDPPIYYFTDKIVGELVDALERQQADIHRKDLAFADAVAQISECGAQMDDMQAVVEAARKRKEARENLDAFIGSGTHYHDTLLSLHFACMDEEDKALAALDAPPEGDG